MSRLSATAKLPRSDLLSAFNINYHCSTFCLVELELCLQARREGGCCGMKEDSMFQINRWYGVSETAEILGVCRQTVWKWARAGKLPPIHGSIHRLRGDHLRKWADEGKAWSEIEGD